MEWSAEVQSHMRDNSQRKVEEAATVICGKTFRIPDGGDDINPDRVAKCLNWLLEHENEKIFFRGGTMKFVRPLSLGLIALS